MADQVAQKEAPKVDAPTEERYADGSIIKKGSQSAEFWPTEAKAVEIANGRQKGARRAFTVKDKAGTTRYATATHIHYLEEYVLTVELGYVVDEIGKGTRSKAPISADSMMAAIAALPTEKERENLKAQLAELMGIKLPAVKK